MRQHRQSLIDSHLLEQCIEQNNPLGTTQTREVRIGMSRAFRSVHGINAAGFEAELLCQRQNSIAQLALREAARTY